MEGRAHIGVGVKGVKPGHKPRQKVVPLEGGRPELLLTGVNQVDDAGQGIGQDDKPHKFPKAFRVEQQQVQMHPNEKDEPVQIGEQKKLTERHQIIQGRINGMVVQVEQALQGEEHQAVNGPEE